MTMPHAAVPARCEGQDGGLVRAGRDRGVVAVLTAAGSGTRLGSDLPKALVPVGGTSLVRRAAQGLVDSGVVDLVVVTAPAHHLRDVRREVAGCRTPAGVEISVVAGSPASRQASVASGLQEALRLAPHAGVVLVHDAARALTPPAVTARVVAAVRAGHDAVVPALVVTDTIKQVAAGPGPQPAVEPVESTLERSRLRAVQTPQGFATDVLVRAHHLGAQRAGDEALAASDDAALVEAAGGRVVLVPGDPMALKVTTPVDLALAEVLVATRRAAA